MVRKVKKNTGLKDFMMRSRVVASSLRWFKI